MQFLDEHAQPSISGLLPVRLVPRQRARDLTRLCTRSSGSTLRIFMSIYSILPRLVQPTLFYSMHCFFFSAHFSASLYLTLLYMYRLTAFKASELRYFRLRCFCTPHLCVGFLVFVSVSRPRPPPVRTTLSRAIFHNTIFHAQLCHTQSFTTQSFTHILTLSHTIFHNTNFHIHISHTQLCHTQCFTIFPHISPTHNLSQHNRCCISLLFLWVAESFSAAVAHLSNSAPCLCWPSAARSHQATSVPLSETKRCVAILHPFLHLVCRTCFYLYSWHISLISMLLCPNA